uniref:Uncharacterized protein n=1 Tax=Rhizophora mucronata TaxID=61149 RepID=A0A2P2PGD8_RHIMU
MISQILKQDVKTKTMCFITNDSSNCH